MRRHVYKKILAVLGAISFYLLLVEKVNAQVLINEFSSGTTSDWVELYNLGNSDVDLSNYRLRDSTDTNKKDLSGIITSKGYTYFAFSNYLNKDGDTVKLFFINGTNEDSIDKIVYGSSDSVCFPNETESVGRYPDGGNTIDRFSTPSKGSSNNQATLNACPVPTGTPTQTPTFTPFPSQTPIPTPTPVTLKGYYKINEAKDVSGAVLSQVKIYIDGVYIHHYTPETLTFCDGCKCDEVSCGFGSHTVKLEKSGYKNWSETRTININDNHEVSPILLISDPSVTSTITPKPTVKPTLTTAPLTTGDLAGGEVDSVLNSEMILGYQNPESVNENKMDMKEEKNSLAGKSKFPVLALLFIMGGFLLTLGSIFTFVKIKKNEKQNSSGEIS